MPPLRRAPAGPLARAIIASLGLSACSGSAATARDAVSEGSTTGTLRFTATASDSLDELRVNATLPAGLPAELSVATGAEPYIRDVEVRVEGRWLPVAADGTSWRVGGCAEGCELRYRYLLADAADRIDDINLTARRAGMLLAPPSLWAMHPVSPESIPFRLQVEAPAGYRYVTGLWAADEPGVYRGDARYLWFSPYSAFGRFDMHELTLGGAKLVVAISTDAPRVRTEPILAWLEQAARAITAYYGRYPVERVALLIGPTDGGRIFGMQKGGGGASILLSVGERAGAEAFGRDWIATHEMVHLAVPDMPSRHAWLTEGLATYVEPLARARIGSLSAEEVWREVLGSMHQGLPRPGDRGLDHTPTWARTYWGGALFCLLADVEIRRRTANDSSLDAALRGVLDAGGHTGIRWPIERFFAVADQATGTDVLASLYAAHQSSAVQVDLPALYAELGVSLDGDEVRFDETAPLAHVRRAITATREAR